MRPSQKKWSSINNPFFFFYIQKKLAVRAQNPEVEVNVFKVESKGFPKSRFKWVTFELIVKKKDVYTESRFTKEKMGFCFLLQASIIVCGFYASSK